MSQQQESITITPEAPYAIQGYLILDIVRILQEMPRGTDSYCRQIESLLSRVQPLTLQQPDGIVDSSTPEGEKEEDAPIAPPNV
jgi:hypothetical protein